MSVELTVCGSAGSHTGPGRACSGYLLRADGHAVMLDCGNGSTANLQTVMGFHDLDAVVVSHRHVDHCVDLVGMYYQLKFAPDGPRHVDLHHAPQVLDLLTGLLSEDSAMEFRDIFHCHQVEAGGELSVGPFDIQLYPARHPVPTLSMRVSVAGRVIAYSADTAGGPDLLACAEGADLFLCEATWQGDMDQWPDGVHLTARAAGRAAREAGAERLVLTHIQGGSDLQRSLAEARETFPGDVVLAQDNHSWMLT